MTPLPLRNQKLEYRFLTGRQAKSQRAHTPFLPLCAIFAYHPTGADATRRCAGAVAGVALPLALRCGAARATVAVFLRAAVVFAVAGAFTRADVPVARLCAVDALPVVDLAVLELAARELPVLGRTPVLRSPG